MEVLNAQSITAIVLIGSGSNQVNPNGSISTALALVVLTNIRLGQNGPAETNSLDYTIALLNAAIKSFTGPVL